MTGTASQPTDAPLASIVRDRVVPVVPWVAPGMARPLADALAAGGLGALEVTLRFDGALEAIRAIGADGTGGVVVGAGTVLSAAQAEAAAEAGARFIVSPGISAAVVRRCRELGVSCIPGVATATEVMAALDEGLTLLKFFPAEASGGVATLKALAAVFGGVRWVPTGGIGAAQLADYLGLPQVAAVGGSWMVLRELLEAGRLDEVTRLAAEAVAAAGAAGAPTADRPGGAR